MHNSNRRHFLRTSALTTGAIVLAPHASVAAEVPTEDPAAALEIAWTAALKWNQAVDIRSVDGGGNYWDSRLAKAQQILAEKGGGVVYFPAGEYGFENFIELGDGIILRGATPGGKRNAQDDSYLPPSKLTFPEYVPLFKGDGSPIDTAFKGILLAEPEKASNCGVVNLSLERGHIHMIEGEDHTCGSNRIVFGCLLTNAAVADPKLLRSKKIEQPAWHRFTSRHHAAIEIKSAKNLLVANNRLPQSGQSNFTMKDYVLEGRKGAETFDVVFDYDNRPGLYINHYCIGGSGGSGDDGTPESHPYGFRKGTVIRDNYIFNSGRMGIGFCGDGVLCNNNVIRFQKDVFRPTTTGAKATYGSSTNDNRAIEARGWRYTIDGNDYDVDRNIASDRSYRINDGEGIMHEDHCNSDLRDSRITNNKGNSYLSIYKCGTIDGLLIEGNDVSVPGDIADIYVVANRNSGKQPCRNVTIQNNITRSHGIYIAGDPAANNLVKNNEHKGGGGKLTNEAKAKVEGNKGYT